MDVEIRHRARHLIVAIRGELDFDVIVNLEKKILPLLTDDLSSLVIDMTNLTYIDSSGIGLLTDLRNRMLGKDCQFTLLNLNERMRNALTYSALKDLFTILRSEDDLG